MKKTPERPDSVADFPTPAAMDDLEWLVAKANQGDRECALELLCKLRDELEKNALPDALRRYLHDALTRFLDTDADLEAAFLLKRPRHREKGNKYDQQISIAARLRLIRAEDTNLTIRDAADNLEAITEQEQQNRTGKKYSSASILRAYYDNPELSFLTLEELRALMGTPDDRTDSRIEK